MQQEAINNNIKVETSSPLITEDQKKYRTTGLVVFIIAVGLLLARIIVYHLPVLSDNAFIDDTLTDVIFSTLGQILCLTVIPYIIYRRVLKFNNKQVLKFSNFNNTKWYNYILAIAIGVLGTYAVIGVSMIWQIIIRLFGYNAPSGSTIYPETFNLGFFILSLVLTAVLPGFCEEFAMRGGLFTTMRSSNSKVKMYLIMGLAFGLFHQNITQVFYTACMGFMFALVVDKTKSIFPGMIIHFLNNGISVYRGYAERFGWWGGNFYDSLSNMLLNNFFGVFLIYVVILAAYVGLLKLLCYLNSKKFLETSKSEMKSIIKQNTTDAFDNSQQNSQTIQGNNNYHNMSATEFNNILRVTPVELQKDEDGLTMSSNTADDVNMHSPFTKRAGYFKPNWVDNIFFIGAIVVTVCSTLYSFVAGLFW